MKKIFATTVAVAGLAALSACGGENADDTAAMEEPVVVEEEPEVAVAEPEVDPTGNVIEIQMYTRDPDNASGMQVFKPRLVTAEVGDEIKFVPTDPTHQSSSIPEMVPDGANGWEGEINQEVSYIVPLEGVYGYKCVPHYAAGMVGMVVVGDADSAPNLEEAKGVSHPGLAGKAFDEIFAEAGVG